LYSVQASHISRDLRDKVCQLLACEDASFDLFHNTKVPMVNKEASVASFNFKQDRPNLVLVKANPEYKVAHLL
jgi:hypothetical protein